MTQAYTEELVFTETEEDGVLLAGALTRPAGAPSKPVAFVWAHGYPVSPALPFTANIGRALASHGYAFLAGDTRAHDIGTWLFRKDGQMMLGGAWWEKFDESPRDLAAWISLAVNQGYRGVVLLGHSFGALRVVYYQAERQDPRVLGIVAAAPGVRSWVWGPGRRPDPDRAALAERLVAEGRGVDLLPWDPYGSPMGTTSAQTYLSWIKADKLDLFGIHGTPNPFIARVRCPFLACYGTNDEDTGTAADLEVIRRNATGAARVDTRMIEGADHGFVGHEGEFASMLATWADTLP